MIIGIEGPAGSGKSTMAKTVAREMGVPVLEGGVWYRALTYVALRDGITPEETDKLIAAAEHLRLVITAGDDGASRLALHGQEVTDELYREEVSTHIAPIAQNLAVREVIEPQIVGAARAYPGVIIVGRHLKRAIPEAFVLRLTIDDEEAERRHDNRGGDQTVTERNQMDRTTARLLKSDEEDVTVVDVSRLTPAEQADVLREFIVGVTLQK